MRNFLHIDLMRLWQQRAVILQACGFAALAVLLPALAIGPDQVFLAKIALPLLWLAAVLAILLASERLFDQLMQDDFLASAYIAGYAWWQLALILWLTQFLCLGLPLLLLLCVAGSMLGVALTSLPLLALALLLALPVLQGLALCGAALVQGSRAGGLLLSLLLLPLLVPVLIFGAALAVWWLAALLCLTLTLLLPVLATALSMAHEE